jgi:hypothetical protein
MIQIFIDALLCGRRKAKTAAGPHSRLGPIGGCKNRAKAGFKDFLYSFQEVMIACDKRGCIQGGNLQVRIGKRNTQSQPPFPGKKKTCK